MLITTPSSGSLLPAVPENVATPSHPTHTHTHAHISVISEPPFGTRLFPADNAISYTRRCSIGREPTSIFRVPYTSIIVVLFTATTVDPTRRRRGRVFHSEFTATRHVLVDVFDALPAGQTPIETVVERRNGIRSFGARDFAFRIRVAAFTTNEKYGHENRF